MIKLVGLVGVVVFFTGAFFFLSNTTPRTEKTIPSSESVTTTPEINVDWRASFVIFTNGTQRTFADSKYHNRSEDIFLTADNSQIIHVKRRGVTWGEFFASLPAPFKMSKECLTTGTGQLFCTGTQASLKFYLNGEKIDDILTKDIQDGDKLLVSYGNETEKEVQEQLQFVSVPIRDQQ